MNISPRGRFIYGMLIFIIIGLAIGVIDSMTHGQVMGPMFILFFVWGIVGSIALIKIRCPTCGTSVAFQGKVGGLSIYAGFVRRNCQKCGRDLTNSDDGN